MEQMAPAGHRSARRAPGSLQLQVLSMVRFGLFVAAIAAAAWTTADPDLWGHVLYGRDIATTRTLSSTDPYSFTSDRRWINHEWLAEVVMYAAFASAGGTGLVALKLAVLVAVLGCIILQLRSYSWDAADHDLLLAVALLGMLARYHPVRPQLFSLLLFALMLLVLTRMDRGHLRHSWALLCIFAIWPNFHGGFLVGLGVLGLWLGGRLLQTRRFVLVPLGIASVFATLLTPYTTELWQFLAETVSFGRRDIADWQPVWSASPLIKIGWSATAATAALAFWRSRRLIDPVAAGVVLVLGAASFRVSRIDAFFAIAVVMLLGPAFARSGGPSHHRRLAPAAWVAVALVACLGLASIQRRASCIEMRSYPEPAAVELLKSHEGRLLTYFNWGQYAIWHLSPNLKVSIDGRRETVYSEALMDAHLDFYRNDPGALEMVASLAPDFIWLPVHLPVLPTLRSAGWAPLFEGPVSVVLARNVAPDTPVQAAPDGERCFPGP